MKIESRSVIWITFLCAISIFAGCGDQEIAQETVNTTAPASSVPDPAPAPVNEAPPAKPLPAVSSPSEAEQLHEALAQLGATAGDRGMTLILPSAQFESGQADFVPADPGRIEQIAAMLRNRPQTKLIIEGHTDARGAEMANERLARDRAEAVRMALLAAGVDPDQLRVEAVGEDQPVASNDTAEGRQQNRRVELIFSDAEGKFASVENETQQG